MTKKEEFEKTAREALGVEAEDWDSFDKEKPYISLYPLGVKLAISRIAEALQKAVEQREEEIAVRLEAERKVIEIARNLKKFRSIFDAEKEMGPALANLDSLGGGK